MEKRSIWKSVLCLIGVTIFSLILMEITFTLAQTMPAPPSNEFFMSPLVQRMLALIEEQRTTTQSLEVLWHAKYDLSQKALDITRQERDGARQERDDARKERDDARKELEAVKIELDEAKAKLTIQ
jgi:hypothetical protein